MCIQWICPRQINLQMQTMQRLGKEDILSSVSNKAISDYITQKGIKHSSRAYVFLMCGIRALLDGKVDRYRVSSVYDYTANQYQVTYEQVDRTIRIAVRRCNTPSTNKEFLIRAMNELSLAADENADLS